MLACDETVTLIRHTATATGDTYQLVIIENASWYSKTSTTATSSGENPGEDVTVRIMAADVPDPLPKPGDMMVRGTLSQYTGRSSLAGLEAFRIANVGDNRRGQLRHVVVRSQ